ncbi:MAG TPA: CAP domain-containing protein [Candidatus Avamphibacillus intestinigallinarum]|nr:CAP domain-containing protein [Candidatus Avamphibacillus intestinigallinarum]
MRMIRNIVILLILITGLYIYFDETNSNPDELKKSIKENMHIDHTEEDNKQDTSQPNIDVKGKLYDWIDKSSDELKEELGEPKRKDESAYGYTWWIYGNEKNQYIQFGIENHKIETIYAIGEDISTAPFTIGTSYNSLKNDYDFKKDVSYQKGISNYTFHLKEEDLKMRPLVKINQELYAQLYFDTFTKKLSSIRLLSANVLLKQRPYEVEYRGKLEKEKEFTETQWKEIQNGMKKQIFDITNIMRTSHELNPLQWDEETSKVAFAHSKDMENNQYFSHYGLDGTGLKERLGKKKIAYVAAGENIAAQYPDAPAAMEGWLNSEGHRQALLNKDYTHLGVGVYQFYYTQNFIKKP